MDYIAKDTALTATANAIREKTGSADPIAWLEELGFSEAIAGIEGGGDVVYGSYTPATDTTFYQIQHNLGRIPTIVVVVGDTEVLKSPNYATTGAWATNNTNLKLFYSSGANGSYAIGFSTTASMTQSYNKLTNKSSAFHNANDNTVDIGTISTNHTLLVAGVTYYWFIM